MKLNHALNYVFFLILVLVLMGGAAHAEDFTFNVPVELHKIPSGVWQFQVNGQVFDKDMQRIGYGTSPQISIVNGEYVGTVTLKFNAEPSYGAIAAKDPAKARSYEVYITLNTAGGCLNTMMLNGPYPYDPTKPLVCSVKGNLPVTLAPAKSIQGRILTPPKAIIK